MSEPDGERAAPLPFRPNVGIRGQANGKAKLNEDAVRLILALARMGVPRKTIASGFRVSLEAVCHITSGRNWDWVEEQPDADPEVTVTEWREAEPLALPAPTPPPPAPDPAVLAGQHASFIAYYAPRWQHALTQRNERMDLHEHASRCPICRHLATTTDYPSEWTPATWARIFTPTSDQEGDANGNG